MSVLSYIKETQAELKHVSWPTRLQTIVYTVLVLGISLFIALYLGFFDYLFTSTLARLAGVAPAPAAIEETITPTATSTASTTPPVDFSLPTDQQ
jgi:preprotein translocase SecE subunit